jgi:hypothetical protein
MHLSEVGPTSNRQAATVPAVTVAAYRGRTWSDDEEDVQVEDEHLGGGTRKQQRQQKAVLKQQKTRNPNSQPARRGH